MIYHKEKKQIYYYLYMKIIKLIQMRRIILERVMNELIYLLILY